MEKKLINFVVMGGTHRAVLALNEILKIDGINITFAIFQDDYSWDKQWLPDLKKIAEKNSIPFHVYKSGEKISSETIVKINEIAPEAIIGIGIWRSFLPSELWKISKYGYIGLHGTLLPEYRGFAGINWYVINGEKEGGMQMVQLDEKIDAGKLISKKNGTPFRKKISLELERTMIEIMNDVEKIHVEMLIDLIQSIKNNNIMFTEQDESKSTWTCHRGPDDGEIDWNKPSLEIYNFIRGQSEPFPGAFSFYENKKFVINKASMLHKPKKYVGRIIGKIVERSSDGTVNIITSDGILKIEEIKIDGEKKKPTEFIKSIKQTLGYNPRIEIKKLKEKISELEDIIKKLERNKIQ